MVISYTAPSQSNAVTESTITRNEAAGERQCEQNGSLSHSFIKTKAGNRRYVRRLQRTLFVQKMANRLIWGCFTRQFYFKASALDRGAEKHQFKKLAG